MIELECREVLKMNKLSNVIAELGISKVRLAKYLGVSRQMLYNYLANEDLKEWPREKAMRIMRLLDIKSEDEVGKVVIDGEYIIKVDGRLNEGVKDIVNRDLLSDLKGFNRKEQELLSDIITLLKEKLKDDKSKENFNTFQYLYHFLQSMENNKELKFLLCYISKSMGFTDPLEFVYNKDLQFNFESIIFSAFNLYNSGGAVKSKVADSHKRFVQDIKHKKEEALSRTQELTSAKSQALKELGYNSLNDDNAKEVLEKIAEIQSRKV